MLVHQRVDRPSMTQPKQGEKQRDASEQNVRYKFCPAFLEARRESGLRKERSLSLRKSELQYSSGSIHEMLFPDVFSSRAWWNIPCLAFAAHRSIVASGPRCLLLHVEPQRGPCCHGGIYSHHSRCGLWDILEWSAGSSRIFGIAAGSLVAWFPIKKNIETYYLDLYI